MNKCALLLTIIAAVALGMLPSSPAQAQLDHTWVASNGNDGNNCSRATRCATFDGALAKTSPGGEVTCADAGSFSGGSITASVTINCETPGNNFLFEILTAADDIVILKGLDLDGSGFSGTAVNGLITFTGAGTLIVDNVKMTSRRGGASGILFRPNGPAKLAVSNSLIAGNGTDVNAAGILIKPQPGGSANVTISRTELHGNVNGIYLNGSGGGGAVNLSVRDSGISDSSNCGIVVVSNGPAATAMIGTPITAVETLN
jgi:hypothetical protein